VFAKEKPDGNPWILALDQKDLPLEMHERWSQLIPKNKAVSLRNVTLDSTIFPSSAENMGHMRKETKHDLVKALLASKNEKKEVHLITKNQAEPNHTSTSRFRAIGVHKDNPKVRVYAQIRRKANTNIQMVSFSVSKDDAAHSGLDLSGHSLATKIVFDAEFKRATMEETQAAILAIMTTPTDLQGGKFSSRWVASRC